MMTTDTAEAMTRAIARARCMARIIVEGVGRDDTRTVPAIAS
jgi:hypothetical protein